MIAHCLFIVIDDDRGNVFVIVIGNGGCLVVLIVIVIGVGLVFVTL